jgi:hypothetical protein
MATLRNLGVLAFALGGTLCALWPRRRAPAAGKLAYTRRFVSRRIADRDAREIQALAGWDAGCDNDGGMNEGGSDAAIR